MRETRRLGRNFGSVAAAQVFSQVLAFAVSLVIARSFGVRDYGIFVFGFAFPSWFTLSVSLGLNSVLTIDVAEDRSRASRYLTAVAAIRVPLVVAALVAITVSVHFLLEDPRARVVVLILGAAGVLTTFGGTFASVFRAYEKLEYGALLTVTERAVTAAAALSLIALGFGLIPVSLAYLAGTALSVVLTAAVVRWKFVWLERRVDLDTVVRVLKKSIPFALSAIVTTFLYSAGPVLLTLLRDVEATGYFNAGFSLVLALAAPLSIYNIVFLPAMSRINREAPHKLGMLLQKSQRLFFVLGLPASLGGWFYAEEIVVLFYGDPFLEGALSFRILIFYTAIATAVLGIGTALAALDHQVLNLAIGAMGTTANVALCAALIPSLGHVGAALAFITGNLIIACLGVVAAHRLVARIRVGDVVSRPLIAGVVMVGLLWVLPTMPLWLGVTAGAAVYFAVLLLLGGLSREDVGLIGDAFRGALFR